MSARCTTPQGDRFKVVFESVRDLFGECRLVFREDGMEFLGCDNGYVLIFRYTISAKSIRAAGGEYEFDSPSGPISVHVMTKSIATSLRCSSPRDMVTFQIDPTVPDRLIFRVQNPENSKDSRFDIVLPTPEGVSLSEADVNSFSWHGSVTMPSSLFHDMIRDLSSADESIVAMECDGATFSLTADGLLTRVHFKVSSNVLLPAAAAGAPREPQKIADKHKKRRRPAKKVESDDDDDEEEDEEISSQADSEPEEAEAPKKQQGVYIENKSSQWPARGSYPLPFMQRVSKAKNVCSKITIHVRDNYPIAFVYETQIGTLYYIITQRYKEDVIDSLPQAPKRPPAELVMTAAKRRRFGLPAEKKTRKKQEKSDSSSSSSEDDAKPAESSDDAKSAAED